MVTEVYLGLFVRDYRIRIIFAGTFLDHELIEQLGE